MQEVISQIMDIIAANKDKPQIAGFAQAIKPALNRYAGENMMKINNELSELITAINLTQGGTVMAQPMPEQQPVNTSRPGKTVVFKSTEFNQNPQAGPRNAPNVDTVIPQDGVTVSEREDQIKKDAPINKMLREGFDAIKDMPIKTFLELTTTMGMNYGDKQPTNIKSAWQPFEKFARAKVGI